jgi:drug/metabolite transporter (DMT)-like permease
MPRHGVAYIWNQNTLAGVGTHSRLDRDLHHPVVGVALGILILGEGLSWNEPVGAVVVFLGICLPRTGCG